MECDTLQLARFRLNLPLAIILRVIVALMSDSSLYNMHMLWFICAVGKVQALASSVSPRVTGESIAPTAMTQPPPLLSPLLPSPAALAFFSRGITPGNFWNFVGDFWSILSPPNFPILLRGFS